MTRVVALIAAKNSQGEVGDAVRTLAATEAVDRIIVIDDGSKDATGAEARDAGADVVTHVRNRGKAAAIQSGVEASPDADVYLLVDSDTAKTAGAAAALLEPVLTDEADLVIGALPSAGGKGGFGSIVRFSRWGINRACGFKSRAPLSGQRAVKADLLRSMTFASRYGLEVAMTIDAVRGGARVVERDVPMDHRHRGRLLAGFAHRGRQGSQIFAALWTRLMLPSARAALLILFTFLALMGLVSLSSHHQRPIGDALNVEEVSVIAVPGATWADVPEDRPGTWASVVSGSGVALETLTRGSRAEEATDQIEVATAPTFADALSQAEGTTLIVGLDKGNERALRPAVLVGGPEGSFYSDSTRARGLIDLTDVTATVLARSPALYSSQGRDLRVVPGPSMEAAAEAEGLSQAVAIDNSVRIFTIVFICLVGLTAGLLGLRRRFPAAELGLVLALIPLASYAVRALNLSPVPALAQTFAIAVVAGLLTLVLIRVTTSRWSAMRWVLGLTIALIAFDLITGATLQTSGVFGSDPSFGRFFGLGNPASVLLLVASVLAVAMHVEASAQKGWAIARSAAFLFLITAIDALPGLGTDVGGAIAFAFISITALIAFSGRRASLKSAVLAIAGAVSAFAAIALIDASRPAGSRTQIGNLVVDVRADGLGPFIDIASRKIENNLFSYGFPWSVALLVAVIVIFAVLVKGSRWSRQVSGLPRTATAVAILAGLALYAVNDSGIVVAVLAAVYVIPFVLVQDDVVARRNLEETTWRS